MDYIIHGVAELGTTEQLSFSGSLSLGTSEGNRDETERVTWGPLYIIQSEGKRDEYHKSIKTQCCVADGTRDRARGSLRGSGVWGELWRNRRHRLTSVTGGDWAQGIPKEQNGRNKDVGAGRVGMGLGTLILFILTYQALTWIISFKSHYVDLILLLIFFFFCRNPGAQRGHITLPNSTS